MIECKPGGFSFSRLKKRKLSITGEVSHNTVPSAALCDLNGEVFQEIERLIEAAYGNGINESTGLPVLIEKKYAVMLNFLFFLQFFNHELSQSISIRLIIKGIVQYPANA